MKFNTTNVIIGAVIIVTVLYFLKPTTEGFGFIRPSVDIDTGISKTQAQIDAENKYKGSLSTGEKFGIWIGVGFAVLIIGGVGYYIYNRNRRT